VLRILGIVQQLVESLKSRAECGVVRMYLEVLEESQSFVQRSQWHLILQSIEYLRLVQVLAIVGMLDRQAIVIIVLDEEP
jgi:hypothetical protein